MASFSIDQAFMDQLQSTLQEESAAKVTQDALILLNWAANEASSGRIMFSVNSQGGGVRRLAMPVLKRIQVSTSN